VKVRDMGDGWRSISGDRVTVFYNNQANPINRIEIKWLESQWQLGIQKGKDVPVIYTKVSEAADIDKVLGENNLQKGQSNAIPDKMLKNIYPHWRFGEVGEEKESNKIDYKPQFIDRHITSKSRNEKDARTQWVKRNFPYNSRYIASR
jgi:hypothetical protein